MKLLSYNRHVYRAIRVLIEVLNNYRKFLYSLGRFLSKGREFERTWFHINRKFITKQGILVNDHFKQTILSLRPTLKLYNFLGKKGNVNNFVYGIHPDMEIMIFPHRGLVRRIFKRPELTGEYLELRLLMQKYLPGPKFSLKSHFEYDEQMLLGLDFVFSAQNQPHFLKLLDHFRELAVNNCVTHDKISTSISFMSVFRKYEALLSTSLQIDSGLLSSILATPSFVPSKGSDLAGPNILFEENRLSLLDWEPRELQYRVYWSDIINIILSVDPAGFFSGKYRHFIMDLLREIGGPIPELDDRVFCNTLVAANSFWNMSDVHFLDYNQMSCADVDAIFSQLKLADLKKICITTEILCKKYAH
jgi:hypothetical protein